MVELCLSSDRHLVFSWDREWLIIHATQVSADDLCCIAGLLWKQEV